MKTILEQLYLPLLSTLGFYETAVPPDFKNCGLYYKLDPSMGTGYYWIYPIENLYAICAYQFTFKENFSLQYEHPEFLNLGIYGTPIAKMIYNDLYSKAENLIGYIGQKEWYDQKIQKETVINSVGLSFLPEFNKKILSYQFPNSFNQLEKILPKLNGSDTIPEVSMVLRQIRAARPSATTAKMFYEGKTLEIISLIMQWEERQSMYSLESHIPEWEMKSLNQVYDYLNQHYTAHIPLDFLAKISCMSQNKLTGAFKRIFGTTITERVQELRIEKAKQILLDSDWDIGRIANAVGYKRHASFSVIFKRITGLTPNEFRKGRP
ncbi:helix-turn-helix transcriptional regulator [Clostridium sp. D2Q-14]|uniref:helix-turn-helix domain-containing protein n=1 Tax=Anaeromonas gelatinilytica TaxID=2683194 RepID=UPI00193B3247|nr:AraC family transcriptional regulator [Anaeromonas gelatinilytica]MBS4534965.1 helix-turn-helix transcriptional regulator [Anaeromonas gelatinilytica]